MSLWDFLRGRPDPNEINIAHMKGAPGHVRNPTAQKGTARVSDGKPTGAALNKVSREHEIYDLVHDKGQWDCSENGHVLKNRECVHCGQTFPDYNGP